MTRVTADKDAGEQIVESVKVLVPKAIVSGVIVKEDLGDAELGKQIDEQKYRLTEAARKWKANEQ